MTFLAAVAREEGFYNPGTRPQRNNNPGDIEWGKFAQAHGADRIESLEHGGTPRFAHFPDAATGFAAMRALFQAPSYAGLTVEQALNRWAPPVENNVSAYLANVCAGAECQPTDIIDGMLQIPVSEAA